MRITLMAAALLLSSGAAALDYPPAKRGTTVDDYHGTQVADPYRWLEDPDSAQSRAWIAAQNRLTEEQLDAMPERAELRQRLTQLWNYAKPGLPEQAGGRYFYRHNDGLQNQAVLMVRDSLRGQPRLLLDPNTLSADGTVALTQFVPSPDGRLLAYGLSEAGSDWNRFKVLDVTSGRPLEDELRHIKFSGMSWTADARGFFYSRYPTNEKGEVFAELANQSLYYHRVGTPQSEDIRILARPDQPQWGFDGTVSADGRWLLISIWQGASDDNALWALDLVNPARPRFDRKPVALIDHFDHRYTPLGTRDNTLFVFSTRDAPRGRILAMDLTRSGRWRELVGEGEGTIEFADYVGGRLVIAAMHDAVHRVSVHSPDGVWLRDLDLPGLGTVGGLSGHADDSELFFQFESFLQPETNYRADVGDGAVELYSGAQVDFDTAAYVTEQVFYRSKDGTRVPMFITRHRDQKPDGDAPVYLYGYGGFNISLTPYFAVSYLAWLERGGIVAVPNLRGGGEYGAAWHDAGTKANKQNVFDDFIAAAEYLIEAGWTSADRLTISGGSNGGLLVGAVLNQRPELFGAALPAVGVMDMLRFHKFTIGWAWTGDYGSADVAEEFPALHAYSPYHNIRPGTHYPAVLVTTADHDDRVVPGHSFKYAAALQHAQAGDAPTLIRIETRAGHGAGKPTAKRIAEAADRLAFAAHHTAPQGKSTRRWQRLFY